VPAIEIHSGRVVRFTARGLEVNTRLGLDLPASARSLEHEGARRLHLVDLSARTTGLGQFEAVADVVGAVGIPVDVEGSLASVEDAMRYDASGASRLVFGAAAVGDTGVLEEALRLFGNRVALSAVVSGDRATVCGNGTIRRVDPLVLLEQASSWGISRVILSHARGTDTLPHPFADRARDLGVRVSVKGARTLEELRAFLELEEKGVDELVVGTPLLSGRFTLDEALRSLSHA